MREEKLYIGTRAEFNERYVDKIGPYPCDISKQLDQYSPVHPKNFGIIFFRSPRKSKSTIDKEFIMIID